MDAWLETATDFIKAFLVIAAIVAVASWMEERERRREGSGE